SSISVSRGAQQAPRYLRAADLRSAESAVAVLGAKVDSASIDRGRSVARRMVEAGVVLDESMLKKAVRRTDLDVEKLSRVMSWLAEHDDLSREHDDLSRWTARQLPIPRVHS